MGGCAMASRIGPGPVFVYESLIFARRRQVYAGRMLFVLAVLVGLWISWWNNVNDPGRGSRWDPGRVRCRRWRGPG